MKDQQTYNLIVGTLYTNRPATLQPLSLSEQVRLHQWQKMVKSFARHLEDFGWDYEEVLEACGYNEALVTNKTRL